ncbi:MULTISPECIES: glycosyltransferase [unclassified Arenibacter]|uniref:glycosyltransferase n=1 Tax=unclassified Arenibacter TaxID=2615047 RepID=UPI000E34115C|nr:MULTISPECIES: glycosyltransferase family 2 protein [unclassified Arenibacter]MCM4165940.1 glycosyl transferase family 2 [Arenibacter sp. A80]RFT54447.1 glycosyltransferase family 2 protein [Arenibacter sp. P308M17]
MKEYDITASIVLYNTDIEEVNNVVREFQKLNLINRLFLVDNSPTDILKKAFNSFENIEYIFTGKNVGFGSGHNVAIRKVKNISRYHVVLNADIQFDKQVLETMYHYMNNNEDVGLLAPKILNMDGSTQYSAKLLPTPINLIIRRFIPIKKIQEYFDYRYELRFSNFNKIIEVPYVMGCFMFINCKVFDIVKGFDERFFMYPEDIDLTRRIHEHFKTLYFPKTVIYHKHGKGSYKSFRLLYYHITSMIKYFNKWGWIFDKSRRDINKKTLAQF